MTKGTYVVATTALRPWTVVAGTVVSDTAAGLTLRDALMIVYWSAEAHGLFGVAARGPGAGRVSPRVDLWVGRVIEQTIQCTPEARAAIEAEPWR